MYHKIPEIFEALAVTSGSDYKALLLVLGGSNLLALILVLLRRIWFLT
jgi:hypothetical protein